jgi:2-phospho-L-lactate guanylyltransferase
MDPTPIVALVPLRAPGTGKSRLAGALRVEERAALAGAMLADVCRALAGSPVDRIVVVAGGPAAVAAAAALGVEVMADPPGSRGLDAALRAAANRLPRHGTGLVVAADLPRLRADDVAAVLAVDAQVVVAPTRDGGTGILLRRPPDAVPTAYGPGSAARHLVAARRAGLATAVLERPGPRDDLDTPADLARLRAGDVGPATAALLRTLAPLDVEAS